MLRAIQANELPKDNKIENLNTLSPAKKPMGRLLALDLGEKRVGAAVSDELWITVRPLPFIRRTNWKQLLVTVADLLQGFDAQALVIGLPLNMDGTESEAAVEARRLAGNFELSLKVPVYLQDERLTSREAEEALRLGGRSGDDLRKLLDSEAAAIILRDFIAGFSDS
jgi:putative Holliday junction resolvase